MKKVFILLTALLSVGVINASMNYTKPQKVLVAAELVGFEVEEEQKNISEGNTINTSLKKLGVVTYINPENNKFVALGHSLINSSLGTEIVGTCYDVHIDDNATYKNLEHSKNAGRIYLDKENPLGHVYYDSCYGIFGEMDNVVKQKYREVETASRFEIKKGEATILIRLDGEKLESYNVEIVAVNYLANNKNIRIKITDERLINETGGIVQGMSGTPVMQNGKLVGAINSVSIEDSKDAFAVFIDKLF